MTEWRFSSSPGDICKGEEWRLLASSPKTMVTLFPSLSPSSLPFFLPSDVFYFCLSPLAPFSFHLCVCPYSLLPSPSCLWSILLFIFSRRYSFHSLAIHPPHNLYKLISPCLSAKNVFPEVQITKSSGLFSKLSLVLNRIGHLHHPSSASPLWSLCPGFWELLCLPCAGGGECLQRLVYLCVSSETYSFFSLWMSDWWVTPKFLSSA